MSDKSRRKKYEGVRVADAVADFMESVTRVKVNAHYYRRVLYAFEKTYGSKKVKEFGADFEWDNFLTVLRRDYLPDPTNPGMPTTDTYRSDGCVKMYARVIRTFFRWLGRPEATYLMP